MNHSAPFEKAHFLFLESHLARRNGERRDRLERGQLHAEKTFCEKVWWPLQTNFDLLLLFSKIDLKSISYRHEQQNTPYPSLVAAWIEGVF